MVSVVPSLLRSVHVAETYLEIGWNDLHNGYALQILRPALLLGMNTLTHLGYRHVWGRALNFWANKIISLYNGFGGPCR